MTARLVVEQFDAYVSQLRELVTDLQEELEEAKELAESHDKELTELTEKIDKLEQELEEKDRDADEIAELVYELLRKRGSVEDIPWVCASAAQRSDILAAVEDALDG